MALQGLTFCVDGLQCTSAGSWHDISIAVQPYAPADGQVEAFRIAAAHAEPVRAGSWVGSVDGGSSVNCATVSLCPHGNGTHTECVGHVLPGTVTLADIAPV
jgi:hypothetical protein